MGMKTTTTAGAKKMTQAQGWKKAAELRNALSRAIASGDKVAIDEAEKAQEALAAE